PDHGLATARAVVHIPREQVAPKDHFRGDAVALLGHGTYLVARTRKGLLVFEPWMLVNGAGQRHWPSTLQTNRKKFSMKSNLKCMDTAFRMPPISKTYCEKSPRIRSPGVPSAEQFSSGWTYRPLRVGAGCSPPQAVSGEIRSPSVSTS